MPDIVKHKKFKDDVFWVSYNNPDTDVKVDFLSIKFPENERKTIAGTLSPQQAGLEYSKEKTGNTYETFVLRSSSILPLETFKRIAAESLATASGAQVMPNQVSTYGASGFLTPYIPKPRHVPKRNKKTEKTGVP